MNLWIWKEDISHSQNLIMASLDTYIAIVESGVLPPLSAFYV